MIDSIVLVPNVTGTGQEWKNEGLYFMNPRPSSKKASYDETPCNIPQFKVYPHAYFWWSHVCNHSVEFSPFKFVCSSVFKSTTSEETLSIGFHCTHTWISTKSLQWRPVVVDMSGIAGRGMRAYLNMSIFQGSGLSSWEMQQLAPKMLCPFPHSLTGHTTKDPKMGVGGRCYNIHCRLLVTKNVLK